MKPDGDEDLDARLRHLDETIDKLQKHIPRKTPQTGPEEKLLPISCPRSAETMKTGRMKLHGNIGWFLMFGFGLEHLWFEANEGEKERKVLDSTEVRPGHFCEHCGTVVLWGTGSPVGR